MPKAAYTERILEIPENITITTEKGLVTVKGPKTTLTRDFSESGIEITALRGRRERECSWLMVNILVLDLVFSVAICI